MVKILLVKKSRSASTFLVRNGPSIVASAQNADEAASLLHHETFDLVLIIMASSPADGFDLIRRMRTERNDTPVLAVTGSRVSDRVKALDLGADDAVADPVDPAELDARISALTRRVVGFSEPVLRVGDLSLSLSTYHVRFCDRPVDLTGKELLLLELLMRRKGLSVSKATVLNHLYGGMDQRAEKIIDVFMCKLRRKLERAGAGNLIATVWGHGYMMREPDPCNQIDIGTTTRADCRLVA